MKYKQISIKNFKGIKEVNIDFTNNRIITLVGLNESGKTTILQAINLFYHLVKGKRANASELNDYRPKGTDFTGKIVISGEYEFEPGDLKKMDAFLMSTGKKSKLRYPTIFCYNCQFEYNLHKYVKTNNTVTFDVSSSSAKQKLYSTNKELWQSLVGYIKSELIPEILYYEDFIFNIPDKIEYTLTSDKTQDETPKEDDKETKEWKLVLDDIIRSTNEKFTSFKEYVVDAWESDNETARNRLSAMEKQLDKKITFAWKELFSKDTQNQSQRLNFKEIKLLPIYSGENVIAFSFKVKTDSGKEFSINERSKGCKWFFSFLIFTEFRKKRTDNILFLLDEPASNLHSSAQMKILDAIDSLSDKSVIAYSTHSHYLINTKWLNGSYVVINEGITHETLEGSLTDTDTKITAEKYYNYVSKAKQGFQPLFFQPIFDKLEYKKSQLEVVPHITITEGKNDWITLKYISEVILESDDQYYFYPGKGASNNDEILRLYLSWGSPFLLLLDGDKEGERSKEAYLKSISSLLQTSIFTLKDVLKKALSMEGIFVEKDFETVIDSAFGKGSYTKVKTDKALLKSKFNFAINQLYNDNAKVNIDTETIKQFKILLNFIADHHNSR